MAKSNLHNQVAMFSVFTEKHAEIDDYPFPSNILYDNEIDYHMFTTIPIQNPGKWTVHTWEEIPDFKWTTPSILEKYLILIWIDPRWFSQNLYLPRSEQLIQKMTSRIFSFMISSRGESVLKELTFRPLKYSTRKMIKEISSKDMNDKKEYDNDVEKEFDFSFFVRKNNNETLQILEKIYYLKSNDSTNENSAVTETLKEYNMKIGLQVDITLNPPHLINSQHGINISSLLLNRTEIQKWFPRQRVAIAFFGITRTLAHTLRSIHQNILKVFEDNKIIYDVFVHTYHLSTYRNPRSGEFSNSMNNDEYMLLNPVAFEVDSDAFIRQSLNLERYHSQKDYFKNDFNSIDNFIMALYSKKKLLSIIKDHGMMYDYILFVRPDCSYFQKFKLEYCFRCSPNTITVPGWHLMDNMNDRFAICHFKNWEKYASFFDSILQMSKEHVLHPEMSFMKYLNREGINVAHIPFRFVRIRLGYTINDRDAKMIQLRNIELYMNTLLQIPEESREVVPSFILFTFLVSLIYGIFLVLFYLSDKRKIRVWNFFILLSFVLYCFVINYLSNNNLVLFETSMPVVLLLAEIQLGMLLTLCLEPKRNWKLIIFLTPFAVWALICVNIFHQYSL